jgi:hypothetical protein
MGSRFQSFQVINPCYSEIVEIDIYLPKKLNISSQSDFRIYNNISGILLPGEKHFNVN